MTSAGSPWLREVVEYYDERADVLFDRYESVPFERVHGDLLKHLPAAGGMCLDIGAGSGRDAAYLAQRGCVVTAVEPSSQLRKRASLAHSGLPIRWIDDTLPPLHEVLKGGRSKYDFILVSAVWMHIPPDRREEAVEVLRQLVKPTGIVVISIRSTRLEDGRIFFSAESGRLPELTAGGGFQVSMIASPNNDVYGREVHWTKYLLFPRGPIT
ncbi:MULTISPECIES: class I SAM-dependent methyltransferase [unclassified Variovorax]|uniref:class I SAM-dependent methyltransferase n=1 Tax=unclassified Variovorax TaxID=663243 RepID=UPI003F44AF83